MVEHGLYILKQDFFNLVQSLGGDCDISTGTKRPIYCCLKDDKIDGLFWAIPTTDIAHRNQKQVDKCNYYISLNENDMRSCYYHIAKTTVEAIYKISSCFPIIEKYVDYEFKTSGVHVVMQRKNDIIEIERKLRRILAFEFRQPNYFLKRITDVRNHLIGEFSSSGV